MSSPVLLHEGKKFVALDALVGACNDPQTIANAVAFMKVGVTRGDSLACIMQRVLAGYALAVAGEHDRIELNPEQLSKLFNSIGRPVGQVVAELRRRAESGAN